MQTSVFATRGVALVRRPSPKLAEGILTHIERSPVDTALAMRQYAIYQETLASGGWQIREVDPAPEHPDSGFVEDTLVVCDDLAVVARPGARERRGETAGAERAAGELGLRIERIRAPGTLEGGDVLQVGPTVYVGSGGRSNTEGIEQLTDLLAPLGRRVVPVALGAALHLKSAVTALPDGTMLARPDLVDTAALPPLRPTAEPAGCHVVPLGGRDVLISAAAPTTIHELTAQGWTVLPVDISEFEKLEGCVTCLSVLVPAAG